MNEESGSAIERLPTGVRIFLGMMALSFAVIVWSVYSRWLAVKRWYRHVR